MTSLSWSGTLRNARKGPAVENGGPAAIVSLRHNSQRSCRELTTSDASLSHDKPFDIFNIAICVTQLSLISGEDLHAGLSRIIFKSILFMPWKSSNKILFYYEIMQSYRRLVLQKVKHWQECIPSLEAFGRIGIQTNLLGPVTVRDFWTSDQTSGSLLPKRALSLDSSKVKSLQEYKSFAHIAIVYSFENCETQR